MADSIDRVFVHALNTVKKIPKTGASRPPPSDRMRLYGLYKQAMEGDVDGVMERPTIAMYASSGTAAGLSELMREQDKWDAWNAQKGLDRTEAKRRYVEALVETMHRYADTPDAVELVTELEFVWSQVKSNSGSGSGNSGRTGSRSEGSEGRSQSGSGSASAGSRGAGRLLSPSRRFQTPLSGTDGPMKVLSPMSEEDESEQRLVEDGDGDQGDDDGPGGDYAKRNDKRTKRMERAIVRLSAEIAALREQIATGREWRSRREKSIRAWLGWLFVLSAKHFAVDIALLILVLLWMRRRKDRRFEEHVRGALRVVREYVRKILP
ncbi:putative fatty acid binding protein [Echria macrotheca]|uniref:Fatty acid binding protein n=1 Tax=Echria macrotheca TaxID=438768 RepID=A0AAJ0BN03_9PEZI|nr:putative fatty acid binding protein [Echria macrotheca]